MAQKQRNQCALKKWSKPEKQPSATEVANLLRQCLAEGKKVEIDGLGEFRLGDDGVYHFTAQGQPRVFIAYVEEDLPAARRLFDELRRREMNPWLDREKLLPGQNWPRSIANAIELSDCFIALFSCRSVHKRGTFQSELRYALDCATRIPFDESYLIPVRLEDCCVPKNIRQAIQYLDLFPDWDKGIEELVQAIRLSKKQLREIS
jgi:hypothetical protein